MAAPYPVILLVEDSDIDAELICLNLERAGLAHEVLRARRRSEFDAAMRHARIDLILADYSLPDFDGLAALDIARRERPDIPVVFVSGIGGEDLATEALRRGATDYVLKRNLPRLGNAVARALAEREERARRRDAEQRLVRSEASMRLAMEAASLGLWQYSPDDGSLVLDATCRAMLGFASDAPNDLDFLSRCIPDAGDLRSLVEALAAGGTVPLALEFRVRLHDGLTGWIAMRGRRLPAEDGAERVTGVMQDMTSTRLLESRQRQAELMFMLAAQATGLGMWEIEVGASPAQVWVNDAYRRMAGIGTGDSNEPLAELIERVVHPGDLTDLRQAVGDALDGRRDEVDVEHRLLRADDGQQRWVAVKGRRVLGFDGAWRLLGTVHDVTAQRRQREALLQSNEALERRVDEGTRALSAETAERTRVENTLIQLQRMEAVGQLTAGVAHDFNNLLTVVVSNVALVRKLLERQAITDARIYERLGSMHDAVNRGATLTRQLLAFSRRQRLEPQDVDFNEVVGGMRDILQTTIGGSVDLIVEPSDGLWSARVDPTQMELIILNLAINARDAMQVGGSLRIATSNLVVPASHGLGSDDLEPGEYVCLSVSDSGEGMSPEVLARAFEPFFTTKEMGKGSGLGLAQVYGFAKQSGGGVRIETQMGLGTAVHVCMPRSRTPAMNHPIDGAQSVGRSTASGETYSLLLVDDDALVREGTAGLLEAHGFSVTQASDGPAALDLLRAGAPAELLVVDFAMPRMNGAEFATRARALRPTLPVLFMTGYADLSSLANVPDDHILQKPVEEYELVQRVLQRLKSTVAGADDLPREAPAAAH